MTKMKAFLISSLALGLIITAFGISGHPQFLFSRWQANEKKPEEFSLQADYFAQNPVGRAIASYLSCIDFDCQPKLQALISKGADAVPPLIALLNLVSPPSDLGLTEHPNRVRLCIALGRLQDARAIAPLLGTLTEADAVLRAQALIALGAIGDKSVSAKMLPLLRDPDSFVRESAASSLESLKDTSALGALRDAISIETSKNVRDALAKAIQTLETVRN